MGVECFPQEYIERKFKIFSWTIWPKESRDILFYFFFQKLKCYDTWYNLYAIILTYCWFLIVSSGQCSALQRIQSFMWVYMLTILTLCDMTDIIQLQRGFILNIRLFWENSIYYTIICLNFVYWLIKMISFWLIWQLSDAAHMILVISDYPQGRSLRSAFFYTKTCISLNRHF